MIAFTNGDSLEEQISAWRTYLRRHQAIYTPDVEELETHLRDQVAALVGGGLAVDEAFLVAVKRMGNFDALSCEFAREHSERLWKQLHEDDYVHALGATTGAIRRSSSWTRGINRSSAASSPCPHLRSRPVT